MAGTKVDYTKKYLEKVNSRLAAVDNQDPFYDFCSNAISGGENVFFQKYRMETRLFDFDWIDTIEEALDKIDNVIRAPKSFIKDDSEVVPIEKAKRTGYEAVKHLSSHSQFVKEVTADGFVKPSKILTSERNIDYAIYENRFVKTLLLKLVPFVEKRYDALVKLMNSDYFNKMNSKSQFNFNGMDVDYELNLSIHRKITDGDKAEHNEILLERAKIIRQRVLGFYNSEFMSNLAGAREVFPPIQRTNILMKEPNYHKCYQLWAYIAAQGDFKYEIDVKEADIDFSKEYKEQIKHLTLLAYATSVANDPTFGNIAFDKDVFVPVKPKEMKVLKDVDEEARDNSLQMETDIINEFYYQEARKLYRKNIESKVNDGDPYHIALKDVYMQSTKITDAIFNSLLEVPDDIKDNPVALLRFKKRKLESFKAIIRFKEQDMAKWRRAQNRLENEIIKDTVKANAALGVKDKETLEKERKAAEQILAKERAKEAARIAKEAEKQKAREAIERAKAKEAAKKAKEAEQARLAKEAAKQAKMEEQARKAAERAEREKQAEQRRIEREKQAIERARLAEERRIAKEAEMAEKARIAEEKRIEKEKADALAKAKALEEERLALLEKASKDGFDEDDQEVLNENGDVMPPKTFDAKLEDTSDKNKEYFASIKEHLDTYADVSDEISYRFDNYKRGDSLILKIGIGGDDLKLYLALNPAELDKDSLGFEDLSSNEAYANTKVLVRVNSDEALSHAHELINILAKTNKIYTEEEMANKLNIVSKPFADKFKESSKETKDLYRALKKHILQYPVSEVPSKKHIAFKKGANGKTLLLVNFGGNTLKAFFAVDASEIDRKKFYHTDVKSYKAYETTPSLIKLTGDLNLERACKLVDVMMEKYGIAKGKTGTSAKKVETKEPEKEQPKKDASKKQSKPKKASGQTKKATPKKEVAKVEKANASVPEEDEKLEPVSLEESPAVEKEELVEQPVEEVSKPSLEEKNEETPVEEEQKVEDQEITEEKADDVSTEDTPVEEQKAEEAPVEEQPVEQTEAEPALEEKVEEAPVEEPKVEDQPVDEQPEEAKDNETDNNQEDNKRRGLFASIFGRRNKDNN